MTGDSSPGSSAVLTGDSVIFTGVLPLVKSLLSPFKCSRTHVLTWDGNELLSLLAAASSRRGTGEVSAASERSRIYQESQSFRDRFLTSFDDRG